MRHQHGPGSGFSSRRRAAAGFTILELMFAITIGAILLGIGVPGFRQYIMNSRISGTANDLTIAFTMARGQAIKTHVQTIVCLSSNPTVITPSCDGNGTQGWVVFTDTNGNGAPDATSEPVLLRHGAMPTGVNIRTKPDGNAGFVAYAPSGFSKRLPAVGTDITNIVMCDSRGNTSEYGANNSAARGIEITSTGRSRVTRVVADIALAAFGGCP
jgi:type IV fimbrial biogenesis protein FimT